MNIILYNFDDATSEELVDFANQMNASLHFALSLQEAETFLQRSKIEFAVMHIRNNTEMINIEKSILDHPDTAFYIDLINAENCFKHIPPNFHITNPGTNLLQIAEKIKKK